MKMESFSRITLEYVIKEGSGWFDAAAAEDEEADADAEGGWLMDSQVSRDGWVGWTFAILLLPAVALVLVLGGISCRSVQSGVW